MSGDTKKILKANRNLFTIVLLILLFFISIRVKNLIYQGISLSSSIQLSNCDYSCANKCAMSDNNNQSEIEFSNCLYNQCGCLMMMNNKNTHNDFSISILISVAMVIGVYGIVIHYMKKTEVILPIKEINENAYYELLDKEGNNSKSEDEIDFQLKDLFI